MLGSSLHKLERYVVENEKQLINGTIRDGWILSFQLQPKCIQRRLAELKFKSAVTPDVFLHFQRKLNDYYEI